MGRQALYSPFLDFLPRDVRISGSWGSWIQYQVTRLSEIVDKAGLVRRGVYSG
jgi:hypothetical protein